MVVPIRLATATFDALVCSAGGEVKAADLGPTASLTVLDGDSGMGGLTSGTPGQEWSGTRGGRPRM
ncbi:hypothetical protein GCM10017771_37800 [Streptomyces capitiformicae]|uniref:Uncharacterized protein n=1 Tax=Streptomyces capitiformicae TaxID=2014920 RepID=A0A919GQW0_9ACTN|nr:hypothetical protein GCM10017771_37800 [Streptomyces capitiformicae]